MARFGAFLKGAFGGLKPDTSENVRRIKNWACAALSASPDTVFAINEIACNDPGCPGIETVILIMEPGTKTRACKIPKPLEEILQQDVVASLQL